MVIGAYRSFREFFSFIVTTKPTGLGMHVQLY